MHLSSFVHSLKRCSLIFPYSLDKVPAQKAQANAIEGLGSIETVLNTASHKRSVEDIKMLVKFTADIDFFKKLREENTSEAHVKCCRYMNYERFGADERVIDYGEVGDKFYIILQGSVRVFIPSSTQEGNFEETGVLCKGKSFGELALTKDMPRAARIITGEQTHFATLNKRDFKAILGKLAEQALNNRVAYLFLGLGLSRCSSSSLISSEKSSSIGSKSSSAKAIKPMKCTSSRKASSNSALVLSRPKPRIEGS
jgi:CRP-like cAMP-binding protein